MTTPTDHDLGTRLRDRARADAPSMALDPDRVLDAGRRRVRRRRRGAGLGLAATTVAVVASLLTWTHPATGPAPATTDHLAALDLRLVTSSRSGECTAPALTTDAPGTACDLGATTTYELGESLGHVTPASVQLGGGQPAGATVTLTFEGTDQATFAAVTDDAIGQQLAMLADGTVLLAAQVMSPIPGGSMVLSADTPATASAIVAVLTGHDDAAARAAAIEAAAMSALVDQRRPHAATYDLASDSVVVTLDITGAAVEPPELAQLDAAVAAAVAPWHASSLVAPTSGLPTVPTDLPLAPDVATYLPIGSGGLDALLVGTLDLEPDCTYVVDDQGRRVLPVFARGVTRTTSTLTYGARTYTDGQAVSFGGGGIESPGATTIIPATCRTGLEAFGVNPPGDGASAASDPPQDAIADGAHTGYVESLDESTLVLRPAEMLRGEDAIAAAHQAGQGDPPDGFFIVDGGGSVELPLDANASVTLIDSSDSRSRAADLATLRQVFAGEPPAWTYGAPERFFASVTVADGSVTGIDEVYLP